MESPIYSYSLCVSLTLMLFFAFRFIFGTLPEVKNVDIYKQSRSVMGLAMIALSANYAVHLFVSPRNINPDYAIFMNLSTYFIASWLFSCALMHLMVRGYLTHKRFYRHILFWIVYSVAFFGIYELQPNGELRKISLVLMSLVFMTYSGVLAYRLFVALHRLRRMLDSYHSDNVYAYVRWMSVFTYWAIIFGVGQGVFTFIPTDYVYLWIISAIPFYIYTYVSYKNYIMFYEKVDKVNEEAVNEQSEESTMLSPTQDTVISERLEKWIADKGFTQNGLTIVDLAKTICTNRTYVSSYINNHYKMSFREWINELRLGYAKRLLIENPDMTISDVAQAAGYMSLSYFTKTFNLSEGITPGKWRKSQVASSLL